MKRINVAIIGCGYWGPNYARVVNELSETKLAFCCDLQEQNLIKMKKLYPHVKVSKDYKKIARKKEIDAAIIATPLNTHYEIAKEFLENGKHVLIEKPFTSTIEEGLELKKIAKENNLVLMVGHVYVYNPGIWKVKELLKDCGNIYYIYAERMGLGPIRKHANVLWDLAVHDISILLYLLEDFPERVVAIGEAYLQENIEDIVYLTLKFKSKIIANICASWLAPEKIRKITIVGEKKMIVFDDVNKTEMVKVYEREINKDLLNSTPEYIDHQLVVRVGSVYIPKIELSEPLKNQVKHFIECIMENKKPLTDAESGIDVLRVLIGAEKSLKEGKEVCL